MPCAHPRRPPRRARPRAAPGGRGAPGTGARARRAPAPARPGRSPTGSPTASPPASTTPTEVLAVTFTTRAAGEMRTRLRQPRRRRRAGAHVPLRRAAPGCATSGRASLRRRAARAHRVQARLIAGAARRNRVDVRPGAAARPGLRDRVGQGQQRRPRRLRRGRARRAAARSAAHDPRRRSPGSSRPTRRSSATRAGWTWRTSCCSPPRCSPRTSGSPPRCARQYNWFVVDEFQDVSPIQSALLDLWLGGRARALRGRRPGADDLLLRRRQRALPARLPGKHPGATSLELVRNYRSTPRWSTAANTLLDGTAEPGRRPARPAAVRPGRRPSPSTPTRSPRRRRWPRGSWRCATQGVPLGEIAVLFRINAQSRGLRGGAGRARAVPYVVRGAARFFERPGGAPGRHPAARRRPLRPGHRRRGRRRARHPRRPGLGRRTPRRPAARPATAGSPGRRWSTRPWSSPPAQPGADLGAFVDELDRRAAEQHAPVADGVTLATLHAAKGLEWDAVFLCGLQEGTLPIIYAETPAAVEEERRLLYVGMTRARRHLALSWAWPATPAAARSRKPQPLPRRAAARRRGGRDGRRRRPRQPAPRCGHLPRVRQAAAAPARRRRPAAARTARRRTTRSCSSGCAPGGCERAGRRQGAGVRGVHRRHPAADRRAPADHGGRPAGHQRHRPVQARAVRRAGAQRGRRRRSWRNFLQK